MTSKTTNKFSPEVRERAVRLVLDHEGDHPLRWMACQSISAKIGCSAHILLDWVKKAEAIHREGLWRSFETVDFATRERVDWFNHRRLMRPIGDIPPAEAEKGYYATLDQLEMAA